MPVADSSLESADQGEGAISKGEQIEFVEGTRLVPQFMDGGEGARVLTDFYDRCAVCLAHSRKTAGNFPTTISSTLPAAAAR